MKAVHDGAVLMWAGKLFHDIGPATAKALPPLVFNQKKILISSSQRTKLIMRVEKLSQMLDYLKIYKLGIVKLIR